VSDARIAATAPPNDLAPDQLRLRPDSDGSTSVDPARAGWRYLSFSSRRLPAGGELHLGEAMTERAIVILAGSADLELEDGGRLALPGRPSVWEGLPWAAYLPPGFIGRLRAGETGVRVAIASAPSAAGRARKEPVVIGPADVRVEVRGAGNATRQINHVITPDFPADHLEVVEVYTPSGNWSSWPPHKHDTDDMPREAVLEEVYCYAFRRPEAWGIQRLYRRDGSRDAIWAVHDGDLVLVTDGYHPFVATHGDDAYYLNALAGDRRTMACSFDPDLDWVREAWTEMVPDPRVPLVAGPVQAPP
jgi:5-deoxy-glucuronate isomerase